MRAAWYEAQGAAADVLQVGTLPDPAPGAGEVRVRVSVSGVNPVDVKRRQGGRGAMGSARVIPHFDGAGVIDQVGSGVDASRIGQRVWLYEAQWQRDFGTAAQWVVVPERLAVPLPPSPPGAVAGASDGLRAGATSAVDVDDQLLGAACLGIPALTAYQCVFGDGPITGQLVLVTGGAGGVGHYAVQFARLGGADVIATVSNDEKAERAATAGANHVLNYREQDVAAQIDSLCAGAGVDRVVDVAFAANLETTLQVLKPGGTISTYACDVCPEPVLPFYRLMYLAARLHFELVFAMPEHVQRQALTDITGWLADGRLQHQPGPVFPLSAIVEAHEAVEAGSDGRVLVVPD
jgi:NADPH2:quinone reductase